MSSTEQGRSRGARIGRLVGLAAAALLITVPIAQMLVSSWQVHPLLVVPAYLLGIPVWLTVVAQAWSGVRRVQALAARPAVASTAADAMPVAPAAVRIPAPRTESITLRPTTPTP